MKREAMRGLRSCFSAWNGWWDKVGPAPVDPIMGIGEAFQADASPNKMNLGVGAYRDDEGKPVVLQCVRDAAAKLSGSEFMEYLPMGGSLSLTEESVKLAYGENSDAVRDRRFAAVQALSGTGACRLFAEFQKRFHPESLIYMPVPTWPNHHNIWRDAQVPQRTFRYYHPESKSLDFAALLDDIKRAPSHSFFVLHACAHNPTGIDPSAEQWKEISYQFKVKNHFPFFDMAYHGFASGDLDLDSQAVRIFMEDGHLIACAQSYAKNMGLYGQRVGCLSILCRDEKQALTVRSQLQQIARPMYSNPPAYGAFLVNTILSDQNLKNLWVEEMRVMARSIKSRRVALREKLERMGSSLNWQQITDQIGMFWYSELKPEQVDELANKFHIYMTYDGRVSMAGVNIGNLGYLANAVHEVTKCTQKG